jgi:hypothetical protein
MDSSLPSRRTQRSAAQKASAKVSAQLSSSESASEEDGGDRYESPAKPKKIRRTNTQKKVGATSSRVGPRVSKRKPVPAAGTSIKADAKRRQRSPSDASTSTDICSSLTEDTSPDVLDATNEPYKSPRALKRARTRNSISPRSSRVPPSRTSSFPSVLHRPKLFERPASSTKNLESWTRPLLGSLIWALVDGCGRSFEPEHSPQTYGYWWPAEVSTRQYTASGMLRLLTVGDQS